MTVAANCTALDCNSPSALDLDFDDFLKELHAALYLQVDDDDDGKDDGRTEDRTEEIRGREGKTREEKSREEEKREENKE